MNTSRRVAKPESSKLSCPIPFVLAQTRANSERYVRLLRQAGREYPDAFGFKHGFTPKDAEDARTRFMGYGIVTLVCADDEDRLIGAVCYRRVDDTNRLQMAYLCRLKRVRDQAIGQLLYRGVLAEAQRNGGSALSFDVMQRNQHAIAMYRAANAQISESYRSQHYIEEPFDVNIEGEDAIQSGIAYLNQQIMEKNI